MPRFIRFVCLWSLIFFLANCANQTQPTGGPMDEDPPQLESSEPEQSELNVSTSKVELEFNERIKLNNPKEQLIITPRIDLEYNVKYSKERVTFTFDNDLPDSTTFTFNFREAIQDLTEGNSPDNLKLAFSTGNYLDSISITGHIRNLLSDADLEDITVALYQVSDTLDIFTGPPLYFTKTDDDGIYQFDNIKTDEYRIRAYNDKNKNLTAESKSESYGYLGDILQLDSSLQDLDLSVYSLDSRPFELQNTRQSGTVFTLKFNKSVLNYKLIILEPDLHLSSNFTDETHNVVQIFNTFPIPDSLFLYIEATDSLQQSVSDTTYIKFEETKRKPSEFKIDYTVRSVKTDLRLVEGTINFSKPVKETDYDSTFILIDSLNIFLFDTSNFIWNRHRDHLTFSYLLDKTLFEKPDPQTSVNTSENNDSTASQEPSTPKTVIRPYIYFGKSAFISVEQDSSRAFTQELSFKKPDEFGSIFIKTNTERSDYFIQLIDSNNEIVQEKHNENDFAFYHVPPGTYRIRILIDSNENGKWDIGNINLNQEPEPVLFYQSSLGEQEITIRANFEIVPDPIVF